MGGRLHAHGADGLRLARPLDRERTAVILGNAMAGEKHYLTSLRLAFPELARDLDDAPSFAALPADVRAAITAELHARMEADLPPTTEDTMPGELCNCLAGRVANLFNLRGPNFIVDAACASAMAAMDASIEGLVEHQFDTVVTGGVDRNMGVSSFIKFCAIGALSATGTRPYADGADGFVMGEGAGLFVLKRLADAERDGDRIYAVVRGMAGSSDGKGKGITAPNPIGQKLAIERAWRNAGPVAGGVLADGGPRDLDARSATIVELSSLGEAFAGAGLAPGSIALGSVKSNIGHLKAAAGAAGMLKATLALHHKTLPPSLGFARPEPERRLVVDAVRRQHRAARLGAARRRHARRRRERVRLRRHELPRRARGARARPAVQRQRARDDRGAGGRAGGGAWGGHPAAGASAPRAARSWPARPTRRGWPTGCARARRRRRAAPPAPRTSPRPSASASTTATPTSCARRPQQALKAIESGNPAAWKALQGRGIFRGSGARRQGRVPLHRPGLAVREHARRAAADRAGRRRDVRRGGRDHAAAARRARAVGHHLRRPDEGVARGRGAADAHRDHAAGGADRRHRADAAAGRSTASSPTS